MTWRTLSGVAFASATPLDEPVRSSHYKVRYRDATGKHHSETKTRLVDAERRKAEIEVALATATWRDPRRGELSLAEWAHSWLPTRLDLRPTTWARLETTMQKQVLPHFGSVPLNKITNAMRARVGVNSSEFGAVGSDHAQGSFRLAAMLGCCDCRRASSVQSCVRSAPSD